MSLGCCYLLTSALAGSPPKLDRSWSNYYNADERYCVDYPTRWTSGEAFEGAGFFIKPDPDSHLRMLTEIDVAALPETDDGRTLSEEVDAHIESLRKFELAQDFHILERRDTLLFGSPALLAESSYYDLQNKTTMIDEVVFSIHNGKLFRLELATRAAGEMTGEMKRFDSVFQRLLSSFRFDCPPHALPRSFAASRPSKQTPIQIPRPPVSMAHPVGN